tara:strand:+ start:23993 stop:25324 length:1332 start_codon:yes stop_codon:yes gene_type:complete
MRKTIITCFIFAFLFGYSEHSDNFISNESHTLLDSTLSSPSKTIRACKKSNLYNERLRNLDSTSPMDLAYNEKVQPFIESYLGRNKALISRMLSLSELYFPLFEKELDKHELPLEFKYLAILESALNPKARSSSGAVGLWQFMYLTGKEYQLEVTSYLDDRQDPLKSTQAACEYFLKLYEMFGDWNLVLAAYNGGPGYLQRKINSVGSYDFWDLYPHLRTETRNYIPTFIAINYAMNYASEHEIFPKSNKIKFIDTDTIKIKKQTETSVISQMLCIEKEIIKHLNPSYKKEVFPKNAVLILPSFAVNDFLNNEESNYLFIDAVESKEILIDEDRIIYTVLEGDYLGRIANEFGVRVFQIKKWNQLKNTDLSIGDKLVLYTKKQDQNTIKKQDTTNNEYVIQKGDTLWGISKKYNGISIWKIKALNNLESDMLKPGTKIILPTI